MRIKTILQDETTAKELVFAMDGEPNKEMVDLVRERGNYNVRAEGHVLHIHLRDQQTFNHTDLHELNRLFDYAEAMVLSRLKKIETERINFIKGLAEATGLPVHPPLD